MTPHLCRTPNHNRRLVWDQRSYCTSLSFGPTWNHVRDDEWGPTAKYYIDLEIYEQSGQGPIVLHIERHFPTLRRCLAAVRVYAACINSMSWEDLMRAALSRQMGTKGLS